MKTTCILHVTRMSSGILGLPALLLLICVSETVAAVDNNVIFQAPRSQTVLISQNATFYCSGIADSVNWAIENNGTHLDTLTDDERERRGIITGGVYISNTEYNNSLTILGTEENNQTMIRCTFITTGARNDTPTATFTVWGPPSPPHLTLEPLNNATTLRLTWFPPFTWPGFPIQNYTVRMENTSNSIETRQWNVSTNENDNNNSVTFELSTINGEIASECALLKFNVTAWSDIGESRPGRISGGFPIIPQIDLADVSLTLNSFQRDGSPLFNIRFQAPRVCPFQTANFTILMDQVGTNETIKIGPIGYSYQPPFTIEILVNSSLAVEAEYFTTVTFSSLAGSVSLPNVTVYTTVDVTPTTGTTEVTRTTEATARTVATTPSWPPQTTTNSSHNAGVAAGGGSALILLLLAIITCI